MVLRIFYSGIGSRRPGPNMHYVECFCKSRTTKMWGGAFAPPAPPLATPLEGLGEGVQSSDKTSTGERCRDMGAEEDTGN